jgi:MFS family permease
MIPGMVSRLGPLWSHRDFIRLWLAQCLSLIGTQFGGLAMPLVAILVLHASAPEVGLLTGIGGLPWLLIGLFVGVGVDRVRRRLVLVAADLGRGLALASIPVAAALGILHIEQLYIVEFVVGVFSVFFETAYQSYLPTLVGRSHLVEGNSKLAATESVTSVAGPSIAGVVIQLVSAPIAVAVDACSYLLSALSLRTIQQSETPPHRSTQSPLAALAEGLRFLWRETCIRAFALSNATFMLFFMALQGVLLVYYTHDLGLSAALIGVTYTAGNVGAIAGAFAATRVGRRFAIGVTIIASSVLRAIGLVAVPLTLVLPVVASVPVLIAGLLAHAFGWSLWSVHQGSTRQLLAPETIRGRVNGSFLFIVRGTTALGGFLGAALAATLGVRATVVVTVVGAVCGSVWLLVPSLIKLRQPRELDGA